MITLTEHSLKELILLTEPHFLLQNELSFNGYGTTRKFGEDFVWVWHKEKVRGCDTTELTYLVEKLIE